MANFRRINGTVHYIRKNFPSAINDFMESKRLFTEVGCSLGICITEAAIGYMKYMEGEWLQAKNWLEDSLKSYESLSHVFGIHFMNRWLANVKKKIPTLRGQTEKHIKAAQHIIRKNKMMAKNKDKNSLIHCAHKGGLFVLRWTGDIISIFVESAFKCDIDGKIIKVYLYFFRVL